MYSVYIHECPVITYREFCPWAYKPVDTTAKAGEGGGGWAWKFVILMHMLLEYWLTPFAYLTVEDFVQDCLTNIDDIEMCVEYYARRLNIECLLLKLGHNYCIAGNFHPWNCSSTVQFIVHGHECVVEDRLFVKIEPLENFSPYHIQIFSIKPSGTGIAIIISLSFRVQSERQHSCNIYTVTVPNSENKQIISY